ncbi:MAG: hypothetical protein C5B57_10460 [Blastocatellia bacterium]|nr:MAG: hypothetical protein C5B57_10460 [Blastocatellia bacterium]
MTPREVEEYRALRATIRERGSVRIYLFVAVLAAWAAATIATTTLVTLPVATLLPLLLLAGGFEAIFQLHTGVERIGRYLQVFYGDVDDSVPVREWERTAMDYGRSFPGGSDSLFTLFFFFATVINFVPVMLAVPEPQPIELVVAGGVHALFAGRLVIARRYSGRQRALDLERFHQMRRAIGAGGPVGREGQQNGP